MNATLVRNAVVLGLLAALGPFAIDMYLPALPAIGTDLSAGTGAVQVTLGAYFGAVAVMQLIYGPLSDRFGRKPLLYAGIGVFVLASIGCALAPNVETLIAFRALQGVGACASMSLPLAIVRDLHTGPEAARLVSFIILVLSVSPILAPLAGSQLVEAAGWRAVFYVIGIAGVLVVALVSLTMPETLPAERRQKSGIGTIARNYRSLLGDRQFMGVVFIGAFGIASFFAFIAAASFIYIDHFGVTPTQFSLLFSVNAVFFIGASQLANLFIRWFGLGRLVFWAVGTYAAATLLLLLVTLAGVDSLPVLAVLLAVAFTPLGLVLPSTAVLALDPHGPMAGTAAALMGTTQFVTGAVMIGIVSVLFDGTVLPLAIVMAGCGALAFALALRVLAGGRAKTAAEPAAAE